MDTGRHIFIGCDRSLSRPNQKTGAYCAFKLSTGLEIALSIILVLTSLPQSGSSLVGVMANADLRLGHLMVLEETATDGHVRASGGQGPLRKYRHDP